MYKNRFYAFIKKNIVPLIRIMYKIEIIGKENLEYVKNKTILSVSNHACHLDPFFIGTALDKELYFIAANFVKKDYGFLTDKLNAIYIDRKNPSKKILKEIIKKLSEGISINIFPEGTRTKTGNLEKIKKGAAFFAINAYKKNKDLCILPLFIKNSYKMYHDLKGFFPGSKKIIISVGEPILLNEELTKEELTEIIDKEFKKLSV